MGAFDRAQTDAASEVEAIRYEGKFRLPYTVECNVKSLRAGRYSVSLRSNGKVVRGTLNQGSQGIGIVGVVVRKRVSGRRNDALVVELNIPSNGENGPPQRLISKASQPKPGD